MQIVNSGRAERFLLSSFSADSDDSRYWGAVPLSDVVGNVQAIAWRDGHPSFHWF